MGRLRRFYVVLGLVIAAGGLVFLAFATPLAGTRADFSVYNGGWNGASAIARELHGSGSFNPLFVDPGDDLRIQPASLDAYDPDPNVDAILVLGPRASFTPAERATLSEFVLRGGLLVVADDFGTGNEALEAAGALTRIHPVKALDFAFAKRPEFTVAIDFEPHPLTDRVERALLNHPATLVPAPDARVLANTTEAAWLDVNDDGSRGANEPGGPFPWLAIETVGAGTVVALSDPSVLINGMRDFSDNAHLARNIADLLRSRGGSVIVDEAHRDTADPLVFVGVRLRELPTAARVALTIAIGGLILLAATERQWRLLGRLRERLAALLSPAAESTDRPPLLEATLRRHPDWDETALRHILDGWGGRTR